MIVSECAHELFVGLAVYMAIATLAFAIARRFALANSKAQRLVALSFELICVILGVCTLIFSFVLRVR